MSNPTTVLTQDISSKALKEATFLLDVYEIAELATSVTVAASPNAQQAFVDACFNDTCIRFICEIAFGRPRVVALLCNGVEIPVDIENNVCAALSAALTSSAPAALRDALVEPSARFEQNKKYFGKENTSQVVSLLQSLNLAQLQWSFETGMQSVAATYDGLTLNFNVILTLPGMPAVVSLRYGDEKITGENLTEFASNLRKALPSSAPAAVLAALN